MNYLKVRNTHSWFYYLKNSSCGLIWYRFLKYSRVHVVPLEVMPPINPFFHRGTYWDFFRFGKKTLVRIIFSSHFIVVYPYWIFYHAVIVFSFNMLTYRWKLHCKMGKKQCRRHTPKPDMVWPRWPGLRTDLASLLASNLV